MTWQESVAEALEEQASSLRVALAELENVHELLEARGGRPNLLAELRAISAGLRSEVNEMLAEARGLRAPPDSNVAPLTRHFVRRDPP